MSADLIVFGEDWGGLPSSTQHIIRHMPGDRRILWANSVGLRRPRLDAADLGRAARKLARYAGISVTSPATCADTPSPFPVVQPIIVPMARCRALRSANRALLSRKVGRAADLAGLRDPVLWLSMPSAVDAIGSVGARATVYYVCDDFGALDGVDHEAALELEAELAERADLVLAASPELASRFPAAKTRLLPHGVDYGLFSTPAPRAADLPSDGPVAGFYGSVSGWIDVPLLAGVARALPDWRLVIVGAVRTDVSALSGLANVRLLGPRPHAALPCYSQHWDASLVPFLDNPQIRACNPLKLREYLAAGRPVVSTPFPALAPYAGHVAVAADAEAFVNALRAIRRDGEAAEAPDARRASVAAEGWDNRAAEAARHIEEIGQ